MTDVDLSFEETLRWIFSGLNVNISRCDIGSVRLAVQSSIWANNTEQLVENTVIRIHNSSFHSLDLYPESKAQITDCYIDGKLKNRPTLITANNSDISVQNCHFGKCINKNGSTILYGYNNSHVVIENSDFIQHNSSKGILLMQNNSSMHISGSSISQNRVSSTLYSAITLRHGIHAVVNNTVFRNNSARVGGALIGENQCNITITNCTFSSNKAKTMKILKTSNVKIPGCSIDKNNVGTHFLINPNLFNHTSSHDKNLKLTPHPALLLKSSMLNKKSSKNQEDPLPSVGGAIYVGMQSKFMVTNCVFEGNSAQDMAGAILAALNVTLKMQETIFVGNKAFSDGGAINVQQEAHLRMTNCVLDDNISERLGGAIAASYNVTVEIQETNFTRNSALYNGGGAIFTSGHATLNVQEIVFVGNNAICGGAIGTQYQVHLRMINCVFDNNTSEQIGGAIIAGGNATLKIQETNFTRNEAQQGGAINVVQQSHLGITNCTFEDNRASHGGAFFGGFDLICEIYESKFLKNSASQQGGAINVQYTASLLITNSRLEHNFVHTDLGGGIVLAYNVNSTIRETNFTGNSAPNSAGALMVYSQTECHVEMCIFHNNTGNTLGGAVAMGRISLLKTENTNFTNNNSTDGGAIYADSNSKLQTKMCLFGKNFAKQTGGAIKLNGGATAIIESCHFLSNRAENGGAVNFISVHDPFVRATFFLRNVASHRGGAITINEATNAIIDNITCVGNRSPRGGCLYIYSVTLTLNNSNISENFGYEMGAGILADYSRIQVSSALIIEGRSTLQKHLSHSYNQQHFPSIKSKFRPTYKNR